MHCPRLGFALLVVIPASSAFAQPVFDCVAPATPVLVNPTVLGNGNAGSVTTATLQAALKRGIEMTF